eukprot:152334-Prorocentrum_lima.AAC.1
MRGIARWLAGPREGCCGYAAAALSRGWCSRWCSGWFGVYEESNSSPPCRRFPQGRLCVAR